MIGAAMVRRSGRFLAPIALAAVAVAVYLIIHDGLASQHSTSSRSGQLSTTQSAGGHRRHRKPPKFYVVKQGDTLSQISVKTHVSIAQLTTLNPNLSPNSLQTGQRLRLRR
jgi:LysM repeat protein